jgi:hypothetical protein
MRRLVARQERQDERQERQDEAKTSYFTIFKPWRSWRVSSVVSSVNCRFLRSCGMDIIRYFSPGSTLDYSREGRGERVGGETVCNRIWGSALFRQARRCILAKTRRNAKSAKTTTEKFLNKKSSRSSRPFASSREYRTTHLTGQEIVDALPERQQCDKTHLTRY